MGPICEQCCHGSCIDARRANVERQDNCYHRQTARGESVIKSRYGDYTAVYEKCQGCGKVLWSGSSR